MSLCIPHAMGPACIICERDALKARAAELEEALEEREADMHLRIRAGYDKTVADAWRAEVAKVTAERDDAIRSKEFTHQWYAERHAQLRAYAEQHGFLRDYCSIVANGYAGPHDPPTYAQILNATRHRAEKAERRVKELEGELTAVRQEARKARGED